MKLFGKRLFVLISACLLLSSVLSGCSLYKMPEETVHASEQPVNSVSDTGAGVSKKNRRRQVYS